MSDEEILHVQETKEVKCPRCGTVLDPEDENLEVVEIDGECGAHHLDSVTVRCPKCRVLVEIEIDHSIYT